MSYRFLLAVATLVGTILGVGMFGLPFVVIEAGWRGTLVIGVLVFAVVLICHLAYAHVVALTASRARLPGYAGLWLGPWGKRLAFFCINPCVIDEEFVGLHHGPPLCVLMINLI